MECLAVALKELKISFGKRSSSRQLKCSGNLHHIGYCQRGVLYVYHVLLDNGRAERVRDNVSEFVWLTADTGGEACAMELHHLIVASSNHDIVWYKVTSEGDKTMQVSLVHSLTAAQLSNVSVKGGVIRTLSVYATPQGDNALILVNGYILCQLIISVSNTQLDVSVCCNLSEDMGFMEAILGIQHSNSFHKLIYHHPLLFAITEGAGAVVIYNVANNGRCVGAVSAKGLVQQNPGCVKSSCKHCIDHFDVADDLDSTVICLGVNVIVFKLSTYFTLNKEHLNPWFVHQLAEKLVVKLSHGQGISFEEEEDMIDYNLKKSHWHKRCSKLLQLVRAGGVTIATKGQHPGSKAGIVKWYEDPCILYEEPLTTHCTGVTISGLSSDVEVSGVTSTTSSSSLYANTILPMASRKVAEETSLKIVAMVISTPSTVAVYYGGERLMSATEELVAVTKIIVCSVDNKEYSVCRIPDGSLMMGVANACIPVAILSHNNITVPILGIAHQEFVQKVLIYESAVAAETVCRLNQWDRCFLPINALETALELRQLDTVSFFLNPKEPTAPDDEPHLPVDLLDRAINLLVRAIRKNLLEHQSSQFSSQLLHMTITFVTNLMKERASDATLPGPTLNKLSYYMLQLRECVADVPKHTLDLDQYTEPANSLTQFGLSRKNSAMWSDLSREEVLKDALLRGCLPEAQYHFINSGAPIAMSTQVSLEDSLVEAAMTTPTMATGDYNVLSLLAAGVGFVIQSVISDNVAMACNLLSQMGLNVQQSLRYLCFNTFSKQLRSILVEELKERDWLSVHELESLEYLQLLELVYPVRSFEVVKAFHFKSKMLSYQSTSLPELTSMNTKISHIPDVGNLEELYPEAFGGDYSVPVNSSQEVSKCNGGYLHVSLQLVLTWDQSTRERLLLEGYQLKLSATIDPQQQLPWDNKIQYYLSHNNIPHSLDTVTQLLDAISNGSEPAHLLSQVTSYFTTLTMYSNDVVRDQLARRGVILADELGNFDKLMCRVGRTHCLLLQPHPLAHMSQLDVTTISPNSFHTAFIEYCVKNKFVSLLYHYLDVYGLAVDTSCSIEDLDTDLSTQHCWLDVLLKFRIAAHRPLDPNAVFMASLSSSRLLLGKQGCNVMGILICGRPLIAMAMLMYSSIGLHEAMDKSNDGQDWYVDYSTLKTALVAYPKLQDAIFPLSPSNSTAVKAQDVTVYNLLQGNVPFNVARLFQWQSTNTLIGEGDYLRGGADSTEMPHFSLDSLTASSAAPQGQHLTYQYYLRHGQPAFAYANFVAAKKCLGRNFNKEVNRGIHKAYKMALADFTNTSLACSCIIFTELLRHDSTKLRVHLSAARRLLKFYDELSDNYTSISHQFIEMTSNSLAQQVLEQLEVATATMVDTMEIEICSVEALECWQLIGSFCQLHGLVPSKGFLISCAQQGKWLSLLCHAHQLQLAADELLLVIEHHFVESRVKEHLLLAVTASNSSRLLSPRSYHESVVEQERSHKSALDKAKHSLKARRQLNVRARYYSKMGLSVKSSNAGEDHVMSPVVVDQQLTSDDVAMAAVEDCDWQNELSEADLPNDLFGVLFKCQQSANCYQAMLAHGIALRQPLLALLAACCEGASVVSCMSVWLCSSVDTVVLDKLMQLLKIPVKQVGMKSEFTKELQWRQWCLLDLSLIIAISIQQKSTSPILFILLFKYFDPHNLLVQFMSFYESFKFKADYATSEKYLRKFEDDLSNGTATSVVGDRQWMEDLSDFIVAHMLVSCCTANEQSQLLKVLTDCKFASKFHHRTVDYAHLYRITSTLADADLDWHLSFTAALQFSSSQNMTLTQLSLRDLYSVKVRIDSELVVETLMDRKEFLVAHEYAKIVGAPSDQISVKEVQHELDTIKCTELWKEEDTRIEFWLSTNRTFHDKLLSAELAASFFEGEVRIQSVQAHYMTTMEQVLLLSLALSWHKQARQIDSSELKQREKEIWLSHIKCIAKATEPQKLSWLQDTAMPTSPRTTHQLRIMKLIDWSLLALLDHHGPCALRELMTDTVCTIDVGEQSQSLSNEEADALEIMLGRLLNAGRVNQAMTLASLFEHGSPNLASVLCCIHLAQGKLSPDQLTPGVIKLLASHPANKGVAHASGSQPLLSAPKSQEVIELMELLADRAPHAHHCCAIIIHCFKIAVAIKHPYESIVASDPLDTLTALLSCSQTDRITVAEGFVQVCQLSAEEIADYLCDCVTSALKQYQSLTHTSHAQQGLLTSALTRTNSRLVVYPPRMTSVQFMELAQLCPDPALLGCKLFAMINSSELANLSLQARLSVQVDLLIRAHDCFSIGCNIDGIAMVLELAHNFSNTLNSEKEFKLMVRLLTGIGRFREMSYIIDILVCHDEFETLLSKNAEKEEQFRTALLDYLKKYHNSDTEKLRMVAGKFLMYREQAKAIEEQAKQLVKSLKRKKLDASNPDVVKTLKNAYSYYQDAAASYSKDDCLTSTEQCMSQARLVALQLSMMKNDIRIINLDNKAVLRFLQEHSIFYEALIVADAYKSRVLIEWAVNLYHRVILAGDLRYYNDYKCALPMTVSLFQELASKYRRDQHKTQQSAHNMRLVLNDLPDLSLRHKLLHDLGYGYHISDQPTFNPEEFICDISRL